MICRGCGKPLLSDKVVCPYCGMYMSVDEYREVKPKAFRNSLECPECGESKISPLSDKCNRCGVYFTATRWKCNACNQTNLYPTTHCAHCGKAKLSSNFADDETGECKKYENATEDMMHYHKYLIHFGIYVYSIYCAVSGALMISSSTLAGIILLVCSVVALGVRFSLVDRKKNAPKIYLITRLAGSLANIWGTDLSALMPQETATAVLPDEVKGAVASGVLIGYAITFALAMVIWRAEAKYYNKREIYFDQ